MAAMELPQPPAGLARTRESLHRLAEDVIKPAREQTSGEWTLTETPGGFGTPTFGDDCQVRVEGVELVVRERGSERREPIRSLRSAAELIGPGLLPQGLGDLSNEELEVDPAAAAVLAASYQLARETLERLRQEAGPGDTPTEPTLWPEHFDLAIEMGEEGAGLRVNYGLSPGDENHEEPYFYVGPWTAPPAGGLWNATGFPGAELGYRELAAADDPVTLAVDFALTRKQALDLGKDTD
jgi:hypothetical protein